MAKKFTKGEPDKLKVKDFVITDEFATVGEEMTVRDAARALLDMKRGVVLVKGKDEKVLGVVTERKILKGILDLKEDPMAEGIAKIMDTHILYIKHDDMLEDALVEIKKKRPAAVIVNDKSGGFMGYFSPIDYIEAENKLRAIKKE